MGDNEKLDLMVVKKIMEWEKICDGFHNNELMFVDTSMFKPSEQMADAWKVVDRMSYKKFEFLIESVDNQWRAYFFDKRNRFRCGFYKDNNPAKAICMAAIIAIK